MVRNYEFAVLTWDARVPELAELLPQGAHSTVVDLGNTDQTVVCLSVDEATVTTLRDAGFVLLPFPAR